MKTIKELYKEAAKLSNEISDLLTASKFTSYDDLSGLEADEKDPEQHLLREEMRIALEHLEYANITIDYLGKPIAYSGTLHKQDNGRYKLGEYELTSGNCLEVLAPSDLLSGNGWEWTKTRIEHNGTDYYLVGYSDLVLEGLTARVRGRRV